jgi:arylsulfatase A-like enzyme
MAFEGGVHSPALLSWSGIVAPGRLNNSSAGLIDVLPTLAEMAGAPLPGDDSRKRRSGNLDLWAFGRVVSDPRAVRRRDPDRGEAALGSPPRRAAWMTPGYTAPSQRGFGHHLTAPQREIS